MADVLLEVRHLVVDEGAGWRLRVRQEVQKAGVLGWPRGRGAGWQLQISAAAVVRAVASGGRSYQWVFRAC